MSDSSEQKGTKLNYDPRTATNCRLRGEEMIFQIFEIV